MPLPAPAPVARTYSALHGILPLAAPLAAAVVGLYLAGQVLGAVSPALSRAVPAPGPAVVPGSTPAAGTAAGTAPTTPPGRGSAAADAGALEALLSGRHAWLPAAAGTWPRPGRTERFRLDEGPRAFSAPQGSAANALTFARSLLEREYPVVEVLSIRLVTARHLGPEWPGTSVDAGVTAPDEEVLAQAPAWLLLARTQDRPPLEPLGTPGPADLAGTRAVVELMVVDAATGALLLRPPGVLVDDFEAAIARLAYHPAQNRPRPLSYIGDPTP